MVNPDNVTTNSCRWCVREIEDDASICHHCGRDQTWLGTIQRYLPIGLIIGVVGVVISVDSAIQARQERVKAENALAAAETSMSIATAAQSDIRLTAENLSQIIDDADKTGHEIESLISRFGQAEKQLQNLRFQLGKMNDDIAAAVTEARQTTKTIEDDVQSLRERSQQAADATYTRVFETVSGSLPDKFTLGRLGSIAEARKHCIWGSGSAKQEGRRSKECLGAILDMRSSIAEQVWQGERLRDKMSPEAWQRGVATILCLKIKQAAGKAFDVQIDEYVNDDSWRKWAGYANNVISRTSPYIEDKIADGSLCDRSGIEIEEDGLRMVELLIPDYEIRKVYDDETHEMYEWRLGEEPKTRIIKHSESGN